MSRVSNLATESGLSEDSFFRVPVLLHPHTEALAALLLPGAGNVRGTGLESAHQLWHQDSRIKDVTPQPEQHQEAIMQLPRQGNANGPASGIWVSPPALMSLRDHARQLQQQKRAKECQYLNQDASPGHFEVSREKQQKASPPEKLTILDNARGSELLGINGTAIDEEGNASGASASASAFTAMDSPKREGDGGVVVPVHLMASLVITNNGTQMETKALRDTSEGSGAVDVSYGGPRAMQAGARRAASVGEGQNRGTCGVAGEAGSGSVAVPVESGAGVMHEVAAAAGAGPRAGSVNRSNFSPDWVLFPVPGTGTGAQLQGGDGHGQVRPHAQQALQQLLQQPLQQPQEPQQEARNASRPDASPSPHPSETSERQDEQQQKHISFAPGADSNAPGHGTWGLASAPQQLDEQHEDVVEGDCSMLIDLGPADRTAEGALMPTPERPRAVSASGSWDALRGFSLSFKPRDGDDGITGGAKGQTDGVLGTLALLSPEPLEGTAAGFDVAMAELLGPRPREEKAGEEVSNLQSTDLRKELNSAVGMMAAVAHEREDGFEADDEGEGEAGTREERARAACRLTGRSALWHPLPGLEASPPWCRLGAPTENSPLSIPHLQGHGLDSFSSLALALPPSSVLPTTAAQLQGQQEPASSSLPRCGAPAAATRAVSRADAATRPPILPPRGWSGRHDSIDVDGDAATLDEVLKLKCSLRRAVQSQNTQAMTLILSLLAAVPITVQTLADSQVSDLVSLLQYNGSVDVASAARRLTAGWKAATRESPAAHPQTRGLSQQTLVDWPQPRRPMRGSHRTMSDHISAIATEDFNSPSLTHHQQQQMDVHVRDQASQPHSHLYPDTQRHQQQDHTHTTAHIRRRFALEEEALRSNDLGLQALSLVRSRSDVLAESLAAAAASGAGVAGSAAAAPAASSGAAAAGLPAAARSRRGGAVAMAGQRPQAGLQVRVQLTPLQPPRPQVAPWENSIEAPGVGQVSRALNGVQISKVDPQVEAGRSTNSASESRTVSEVEVCSSGEDTQDGTRRIPREWGLARDGVGSAGPSGDPGEGLAGSSGCDCGSGAVMGRVLSYSPQPTPMALSAAVGIGSGLCAGSRGAGSAPRCKPCRSTGSPVDLNPTATARVALAPPAAPTSADVDFPKAAPLPHNTCCATDGIALPAPCLTQPPLPQLQCAVSPPAAPSAAAAVVLSGRAPATARPLPPSSTLVRKRKIERTSSRRRSVNPGKRQATSAILGQLGPAGSASMYPPGLARPTPASTAGSGGGEAASDEQRYHPPTSGGPVAGVKTPARSSYLGLHPPSSKRQRHHVGLGGGGSSLPHGGGGGTATQVRRVSLLLSSLDLGSGGNGSEDESEGAEAAAEITAAAAIARDGDTDADADMGSQDYEAAMLTSDDELSPAVGPVGAAVSCGHLKEGEEGSEIPFSAELLSLRTDVEVGDGGCGLQQVGAATT